MKSLAMFLAVAIGAVAGVAATQDVNASRVTLTGDVVRYDAGKTIVVRGADGHDVTYTIAPALPVPAGVGVGRRVTIVTEPSETGAVLVTRITTEAAPAGAITTTAETSGASSPGEAKSQITSTLRDRERLRAGTDDHDPPAQRDDRHLHDRRELGDPDRAVDGTAGRHPDDHAARRRAAGRPEGELLEDHEEDDGPVAHSGQRGDRLRAESPMDEASRARIRVFLNDPAARGRARRRLRSAARDRTEPVGLSRRGPRAAAREPTSPTRPSSSTGRSPRRSSAAGRSGRGCCRRPDAGSRAPCSRRSRSTGEDLNAYYDRQALHFFRDVDAKTGAVVQSGRQPRRRHARAGARRPRRDPAGPLGRAALRGRRVPRGVRRPRRDPRRARGDGRSSPRVARGDAADRSIARTSSRGWPRSSAAAVRGRYGPDAALPDALRDAVNAFRYRRAAGRCPDDAARRRSLARAALLLPRA